MRKTLLTALICSFVFGCSTAVQISRSGSVDAWSRVVINGNAYITLADLEKKARDLFAAEGEEIPIGVVASFEIGGIDGFVSVTFATRIGEPLWAAAFDKEGNILSHFKTVAQG
jgi:hypothetical protein